jgi:hypothetical protein
MRQPRTNHIRSAPLMSAQQGALIIKRLERIDAGMRAGTRAAERRAMRIIKVLERIVSALERAS